MKNALLLSFLVISGCAKRPSSNAELNLVDGKNIDEMDTDAVTQIVINGSGMCTATFVSDNTMLTAAHCLEKLVPTNKTTGEIPAGLVVYLPRRGNVRSVRHFTHPSYNQSSITFDISVVVFPDGTFKGTPISLYGQNPKVGDAVSLIGYGGRNGKQKGDNFISELKDGAMFVDKSSTKAPGKNLTTVIEGDSGGPMFINGELIGIASQRWNGYERAAHGSLMYPAHREYLTRLANDKNTNVKISGLNGGTSGVINNDDYGLLITQGKIGNATNMFVTTTSAESKSVSLCITPGSNTCDPNNTATILKRGNPSSAKNGRNLFTIEPFNLPSGKQVISIYAFSSDDPNSVIGKPLVFSLSM